MIDRAQALYSGPELAAEFGVTARALRFYETKGLLEPRRAGTRRVYDHRDRGRLQLILRGKQLGFSLADIKDYLELYDLDPTQRPQLERLETLVRGRVASLREQREALDTALRELTEIQDQVIKALADRKARSTAM